MFHGMEISRLVKIGKGFGKEVGLERPGSIGSILPGFWFFFFFVFNFPFSFLFKNYVA